MQKSIKLDNKAQTIWDNIITKYFVNGLELSKKVIKDFGLNKNTNCPYYIVIIESNNMFLESSTFGYFANERDVFCILNDRANGELSNIKDIFIYDINCKEVNVKVEIKVKLNNKELVYKKQKCSHVN